MESPHEDKSPKTISQRIGEIKRNVWFDVCWITASGLMIFAGSSASVLIALAQKDIQTVSLLAWWAVVSGAALKEFVCHLDVTLEKKEQLFKNYFRR
jgi:hypothetical protein